MLALLRDFQGAFRGAWIWVGIAISGAALYATMANRLQLQMGLVEPLIVTYRATFHPVVEVVFGWLPVALTPLVKDGLVIYLAGGGATARTFLALTETIAAGDVHADPLLDQFVGAPIRRLIGGIVSAIAWPGALLLLWTRPVVVRFQPAMYAGTRQRWWRRKRMLRREPAAYAAHARANRTFDHDLRVTFVLQVSAVVTVVVVMAALAAVKR